MKVLLVEDEEVIKEITTEILKSVYGGNDGTGIEIVARANLEEALDALNAHKNTLDLVLTDYLYPKDACSTASDRSGREMVLAAQKENIPVILMTGTKQYWRNENPDLAHISVLEKPFQISQLIAMVDAHVAPAPADRARLAAPSRQPTP